VLDDADGVETAGMVGVLYSVSPWEKRRWWISVSVFP
jgi:hypothetical protein